jgi:hypothetical protein
MTTPGSGSATAPPQYDEEDLRLARLVLSQALEDAVQPVATLTDEELLAIEGVQHRQLLPLPWAEENLRTDEERAIAAAAAARSMIARGLVRSEKVMDPLRAGEPAPRNEIAAALRGTIVARRIADRVIVAERRTTQGVATAIFYVFDLSGGRRVLWEVFDHQGMHVFSVFEGATLPEQLVLFVDPVGGIGDEDGEPIEIPAAEFPGSPKAQDLEGSRALTSIVVRGREEADAAQFNLFALPDRTELMETEGEGDDGLVRIAPVSRERLQELVESLLEPEDPERA